MSDSVYNKADSILEIRGTDQKKEQIIKRLRGHWERRDDLKKDDRFFLVLNDLFGRNPGKEEKRIFFFLRDHVVEEMARLPESSYPRYLRYRYAYEIYPATYHVSEFPPLVQIEPASVCNYRCVFCYQTDKRLSDKKNGHMGMMDIDLFKEIVDQLEGNVEAINLASRGEPTVNKMLPEMLEYLSGKFLAVKVNTNAYLLDDRLSHTILESGLQTLVFSVDASKDPLYSQLRINGDLERVIRNIDRFRQIKERDYPDSKLITRVSGVKFNDQQSIEDMDSYWKEYVEQVAFVDYNPWENVYDSEKKGVDVPCSDLWRRTFIWWDGKVAPCDVDYLTRLSDESVQNKTISEIWNGGMYSILREKHLSNQRRMMEPCSRCVVV